MLVRILGLEIVVGERQEKFNIELAFPDDVTPRPRMVNILFFFFVSMHRWFFFSLPLSHNHFRWKVIGKCALPNDAGNVYGKFYYVILLSLFSEETKSSHRKLSIPLELV